MKIITDGLGALRNKALAVAKKLHSQLKPGQSKAGSYAVADDLYYVAASKRAGNSITSFNLFRLKSATNISNGTYDVPTVTWIGGQPPFYCAVVLYNTATLAYTRFMVNTPWMSPFSNINPELTPFDDPPREVYVFVDTGEERVVRVEKNSLYLDDPWGLSYEQFLGLHPDHQFGVEVRESSAQGRILFAPFVFDGTTHAVSFGPPFITAPIITCRAVAPVADVLYRALHLTLNIMVDHVNRYYAGTDSLVGAGFGSLLRLVDGDYVAVEATEYCPSATDANSVSPNAFSFYASPDLPLTAASYVTEIPTAIRKAQYEMGLYLNAGLDAYPAVGTYDSLVAAVGAEKTFDIQPIGCTYPPQYAAGYYVDAVVTGTLTVTSSNPAVAAVTNVDNTGAGDGSVRVYLWRYTAASFTITLSIPGTVNYLGRDVVLVSQPLTATTLVISRDGVPSNASPLVGYAYDPYDAGNYATQLVTHPQENFNLATAPMQLAGTWTIDPDPAGGAVTAAALTAGTHSVTVEFSHANGNYTQPAGLMFDIVITKATPYLDFPAQPHITYGSLFSAAAATAQAYYDSSKAHTVAGNYSYSLVVGGVEIPVATVIGGVYALIGPPDSRLLSPQLPVGSYVVVCSFTPTDTTNYNSTGGVGLLTVDKKTLTFTTQNDTRVYGVANNAFSYVTTGFIAGEDYTVLSGAPTLTCSATQTSPPGQYTIFITAGTLAAANYNIAGSTFASTGKLTITKASFSFGVSGYASGYYETRLAQPITFTTTVSPPAGTSFTWSLSYGTSAMATVTAAGGYTALVVNESAPEGTNKHTVRCTFNGGTNYTSSFIDVPIKSLKGIPTIVYSGGLGTRVFGELFYNIPNAMNATALTNAGVAISGTIKYYAYKWDGVAYVYHSEVGRTVSGVKQTGNPWNTYKLAVGVFEIRVSFESGNSNWESDYSQGYYKTLELTPATRTIIGLDTDMLMGGTQFFTSNYLDSSGALCSIAISNTAVATLSESNTRVTSSGANSAGITGVTVSTVANPNYTDAVGGFSITRARAPQGGITIFNIPYAGSVTLSVAAIAYDGATVVGLAFLTNPAANIAVGETLLFNETAIAFSCFAPYPAGGDYAFTYAVLDSLNVVSATVNAIARVAPAPAPPPMRVISTFYNDGDVYPTTGFTWENGVAPFTASTPGSTTNLDHVINGRTITYWSNVASVLDPLYNTAYIPIYEPFAIAPWSAPVDCLFYIEDSANDAVDWKEGSTFSLHDYWFCIDHAHWGMPAGQLQATISTDFLSWTPPIVHAHAANFLANVTDYVSGLTYRVGFYFVQCRSAYSLLVARRRDAGDGAGYATFVENIGGSARARVQNYVINGVHPITGEAKTYTLNLNCWASVGPTYNGESSGYVVAYVYAHYNSRGEQV